MKRNQGLLEKRRAERRRSVGEVDVDLHENRPQFVANVVSIEQVFFGYVFFWPSFCVGSLSKGNSVVQPFGRSFVMSLAVDLRA